MKKNIDSERVAVILGILSIYLAIIFGITSLDFGKLNFIKYIIYIWFGIISLFAILYLKEVLSNQKYILKKSYYKRKISDISVVFQGFLWVIFRNKEFHKISIPKFREIVYRKSRDLYKWYFDEFIELSLYFSDVIILIVLFYFIANFLSIIGITNFFIKFIIILGLYLGLSLLFNLLRYMFIREQ